VHALCYCSNFSCIQRQPHQEQQCRPVDPCRNDMVATCNSSSGSIGDLQIHALVVSWCVDQYNTDVGPRNVFMLTCLSSSNPGTQSHGDCSNGGRCLTALVSMPASLAVDYCWPCGGTKEEIIHQLPFPRVTGLQPVRAPSY